MLDTLVYIDFVLETETRSPLYCILESDFHAPLQLKSVLYFGI